MPEYSEDIHWSIDALCQGSAIDFFSADYHEKMAAKRICRECPVRKQCLEDALENEDRFGIWGGAEEYDIRQALTIDKNGFTTTRKYPIKCPMCKSLEITTLEKRRARIHVECSKCHLNWWTRRSVPSKKKKEETP